MHLYEITDRYREAFDYLTDPENGIDEITIKDTLDSIDSEIEPKMLNVARFILGLEHQADGIKEARKRMESRQKSAENRAEWLRSYLISAMDRTGKTKVSDAYNALSLAKKPPSVIVEDELLIPAEFKRTKTEISIDRQAIKQAGGCPGARVESAGYRISIK